MRSDLSINSSDNICENGLNLFADAMVCHWLSMIVVLCEHIEKVMNNKIDVLSHVVFPLECRQYVHSFVSDDIESYKVWKDSDELRVVDLRFRFLNFSLKLSDFILISLLALLYSLFSSLFVTCWMTLLETWFSSFIESLFSWIFSDSSSFFES